MFKNAGRHGKLLKSFPKVCRRLLLQQKFICARPDEQVDVVGHQHIRMYPARPTLRGFLQPVEVYSAVEVVKEDGLPVVSALDDMHGNTGKEESWLAGHRTGCSLLVSEAE